MRQLGALALTVAGLLIASAWVFDRVGDDEAQPGSHRGTTILAAGNIASCDSRGDDETAALLDRGKVVLTLGDNVYDAWECYDATWGRAKPWTRPTPGNHDYYVGGYRDYWKLERSYYAFDLAGWRIYSLDSERITDAQVAWLEEDLAARPHRCVLAYWHRPYVTAGGGTPDVAPLWTTLAAAGADLVLAAHQHNFQRLRPMDGIRSFVVGTGGRPLSTLRSLDRLRRLEAGSDDVHGVLSLTLRPTSYSWRFIPLTPGTFSDSGRGRCR